MKREKYCPITPINGGLKCGSVNFKQLGSWSKIYTFPLQLRQQFDPTEATIQEDIRRHLQRDFVDVMVRNNAEVIRKMNELERNIGKLGK